MILRITTAVVAALAFSSCAKTTAVVAPPPASPPPAARTHAVLPLPQSIEFSGGLPFVVTAETSIVVPPGNERAAAIGRFLSDLIGLAAGRGAAPVSTAVGSWPRGASCCRSTPPAPATKATSCRSRPTASTIAAAQPAGLFYGVQTLRQLLPPFVEFGGVQADPTRPRLGAGGAHRRSPALRVARRDARRRPAFLHGRRGQALHRPHGAVQVQPPAPASRRRSGLAHRRSCRGRTSRGTAARPRSVAARAATTRRHEYSGHRRLRREPVHHRSFRRSTCRGIPTPRWRRIPS